MRAFLGIEPDATTKITIDSWREQTFSHFNHAVPAANYHITLCFLGIINSNQRDKLEQLIEQLTLPAQFKSQFNTLGYWAKPKALWLGCSETPTSHLKLVKILNQAAYHAGITIQKRDYQAHLTLHRKCSENPPAPLIAPDFKWNTEAFHLYESVSSENGVVYNINKTWILTPKINL